jgi:nitrogenase molybdenum-iron protein alpha/beta subunit
MVYGGEKRLRSVIDGAFEVIDADLYVVLTGCTSDIVGDDVGQSRVRLSERRPSDRVRRDGRVQEPLT